MTERRYNDDEVADIFAQAAQGQQTPGAAAAEEGLTLPQLQEIGREVGIAPEAVAQAAHALALREQQPPGRFLGLPISVRRTVALNSLIGLGMFANGALRLPGWARRRSRQMEEIGAALALPPGSPVPDSAPDSQ